MRKLNRILLAATFAWICASCTTNVDANFQVIPLPQEVNLTGQDPFLINPSTFIHYPEGNELLQKNAGLLAQYIEQITGYSFRVRPLSPKEEPEVNAIILQLDSTITHKEGYQLAIDAQHILLTGQTANGIFYGIQTLRKAIPAHADGKGILIPTGSIKDAPRFSYRGMHLDVGRHFAPVEFIKKYIDLLALHNMNTFHWHLTEDQGWRIEIKKYPRLTEVGSIRQRTVIGRNTDKYDNTPTGGFYTQEQIKAIVKYAQDRYITIIPEIDLPGHMLAALAAYPEMGCTGGPYEVCPRWGVFDDVLCIGNEKSMQFLEDVMTEVVELFPSKYIHIGGDEAPRTRWEKCAKCQARIQSEGLKADNNHTAEDRLQSYSMTRIEKFLNAKGRQIIGWDEILEGDVAPNATVMSWRGMEGGIKAAQLGHDVIMTPTNFCYFDYYQTDETKDEPLAIGGYVPVEKVYSLEPIPASLTEEEKKHILGAQANLWTEYIPTTNQVEYMVLPRMAALAEVLWMKPEKKNYKEFAHRILPLMSLYEHLGYKYARHMFDLKANYKADTQKGATLITLNVIDDAPIYYTLNGQEPDSTSTLYKEPIRITQSAKFRAMPIRKGEKTKEVARSFSFNKATLKPIELLYQPTDAYRFNGAITLVDGIVGGNNHAGGEWLGFNGVPLTATIDLGAETDIKRVKTHALINLDAWIAGSTALIVATSLDGITYTTIASQEYWEEVELSKRSIENYEVTFEPVPARYVRVTIKPTPTLPKGHSAEGNVPYLFVDEIGVE